LLRDLTDRLKKDAADRAASREFSITDSSELPQMKVLNKLGGSDSEPDNTAAPSA
jgi:hypothetical protein